MLIVNMCSKSESALRHAGMSRKFPEVFGGAVTGEVDAPGGCNETCSAITISPIVVNSN